MSVLLAMLLYGTPPSSFSLRTDESVSVVLHQKPTGGASQKGKKPEASSLQNRLDRQNLLFKEQAASDATPTSGQKKSLLGDFSLAGSARQNAIDRRFRSRLAAISSD